MTFYQEHPHQECLLCKYPWHIDRCTGVVWNACTCAPILCLWVSWCTLTHYSMFIFVVNRFKAIFTLRTGWTFTQATEGLWKTRALGGRDAGVPPFKTPTLNKGTLWAVESMRDGYHPKMLLYALDELFYVFAQIKNSSQDEKVMLAYEILCISANRCTDRCSRVEKWVYPTP